MTAGDGVRSLERNSVWEGRPWRAPEKPPPLLCASETRLHRQTAEVALLQITLDSIGQFVLIVRSRRKMPSEKLSDVPHGLHHSVGEVPAPKMSLNIGRKLIPKFLSAFRVNAHIPNDRELLRLRRKVKQHAIALPRGVHFELLETEGGALDRIGDGVFRNKHADLTGRQALRRFDRRNDRRLIELI